MPPSEEVDRHIVLRRVAEESRIYPVDAFAFVQAGLAFTVQKIHGPLKMQQGKVLAHPSRHITGQQLCQGLREYALVRWGFLARTVLKRWNLTSTLDFGQIVFSLVRHNEMSVTENDRLEDFKDVFDFKNALETRYRIHTERV
jgi:uncharacterized repeat protein (TIGR04138 family)